MPNPLLYKKLTNPSFPYKIKLSLEPNSEAFRILVATDPEWKLGRHHEKANRKRTNSNERNGSSKRSTSRGGAIRETAPSGSRQNTEENVNPILTTRSLKTAGGGDSSDRTSRKRRTTTGTHRNQQQHHYNQDFNNQQQPQEPETHNSTTSRQSTADSHKTTDTYNSTLLSNTPPGRPFLPSFTTIITKDEAANITQKYHNVSLLQLYRILWDCFQQDNFQHVFTVSTSTVANHLHHGDLNFYDNMKRLQRESPEDADLLVMRFFVPKKKLSFKKEFFLLLPIERQEESINDKLKRISMKFSASGSHTMELDSWRNHLARSKGIREKLIMYTMLLLGRVRDVTPKAMRKGYERFKSLLDSLLNTIHGTRGALDEELNFFHNFKRKDREVALLVTSWILFECNQSEKAQHAIGEILAHAIPSQQLAFIYLSKARMESHDPELQLVDYTQSIDLFPIFSVAFVNRAHLYYNVFKDADKALEDLESAIRLDPSWSVIYTNRGAVHMELLKDPEKAQKDYNVAISCDANNSVALLNRALVYCELNRYHMALVDFNKSIKANPNNPMAFYNRAFIQHHHLSELNAALEDYSRAIELNPRFPEAYFERALLWSTHREDEEALADFSHCISLNPNFGMAYYERSLLYGTDDMALRDLNKAIRHGGSSRIKILLRRALICEAKQLYQDSLQDFNSCLLLDHHCQEAAEGKQRVEMKMQEEKERRIPREDVLLNLQPVAGS